MKANLTALIPLCKYTVTTINLFDSSHASCNYPPSLALEAGCSLRLAYHQGPLKSTETVLHLSHYPMPGSPYPRLNISASEHLSISQCYKTIPTSHSQLVMSRDVFNNKRNITRLKVIGKSGIFIPRVEHQHLMKHCLY